MSKKIFETQRTYCLSNYWKAVFKPYGGFWLLDELIADSPLPLTEIKTMMKDIEEIMVSLNKGNKS